jgi:hypothetical protein
MTSSNTPIDPIVLYRGRVAVHVAIMHFLERVTGANVSIDLFKEWAALLDIAAPSNYYQQSIDNILLFPVIKAEPEIGAVLAQPDGLEQVAGPLCTIVDQAISAQFSEADLAQAQATFELISAKLEDGLKGIEGDGLSDLGNALDVDIETLAKEPERVRKAFPPRNIGLGHDEITRLEEGLGFSISDRGGDGGIDQYAQALFPSLLQIVRGPHELKGGTFPANSPVWKWAGVERPSNQEHKSPDQDIELVITAVTNFLARMGEQNNRKEMVQYFIARHLRQEYGLGAGRGHEAIKSSGFETWEPADIHSMRGYDNVHLRSMWELVRSDVPPKQQEAMDIYWEAWTSGRTIDEVSRERGRKPVVVRNNLAALKRRLRAKQPTD